MRLFKRLFTKEQETEERPPLVKNDSSKNDISKEEQWEPIPEFIEADQKDYELVSVIATAIAAGEHPERHFVVKKILQRNPEARTVAIIAASLAAEMQDDSRLIVRKIARKK